MFCTGLTSPILLVQKWIILFPFFTTLLLNNIHNVIVSWVRKWRDFFLNWRGQHWEQLLILRTILLIWGLAYELLLNLPKGRRHCCSGFFNIWNLVVVRWKCWKYLISSLPRHWLIILCTWPWLHTCIACINSWNFLHYFLQLIWLFWLFISDNVSNFIMHFVLIMTILVDLIHVQPARWFPLLIFVNFNFKWIVT